MSTLRELGGRVPPNAVELEKAVLGALLNESSEKMDLVVDILQDENVFYKEEHKKIYGAMLNRFKNRQTIDLLTIPNDLAKSGDLELIGGMYYLASLSRDVVSSAHIEAHARIVLEKYMLRQAIKIFEEGILSAFDNEDPFQIINGSETLLSNLMTLTASKDFTHISHVIDEVNKEISEIRENPNSNKTSTGISTGFPKLNELTGGWQPGLIILAARPAVGKSALALEFVLSAAKQHKPVGILNLEMSAKQTVKRGLANFSSVTLNNIKSPKLMDDSLFGQFLKYSSDLSRLPIYIDDGFNSSIHELRAKARRLKNKYGLELLVIDYLQLMQADKGFKGNREQEISKISRGLKGLSKELNIPVIALSQLSRAVEQRSGEKGKIPQLSDLRESGSIEQDADMVLFIYRPEYHGIKNDEMGETTEGETHLIIAKNRDGKLGTVRLQAKLDCQQFVEMEDYKELHFDDPPPFSTPDKEIENYNPFRGIRHSDDSMPF